MRPRAGWVAVLALAVAVGVAGCGRTARDGGGETTTLPSTTPVASEIAASVADTTPPATATAATSDADPGTAPVAEVTDTGPADQQTRLADIVGARIDQREGTLTVQIQLARPLDAAALGKDEQIVVGAYLLASPDDLDPFAARVLIDGGKEPRFLFGPWLEKGKPIEGTLDGTELTLTVPKLAQGRFRYAQFFAEDPVGSETLPDDDAGVVAINAG